MESLVLIVDDEIYNLSLLEHLLKKNGLKILKSSDPIDVLEILEKITPDLILMDIVMPAMSGYELCLKIKEKPGFREVPIIFLTANYETESIVRGFEVGAVDYIFKPFQIKELMARINTHLDLKKSKEELKKRLEEIDRDLKLAQKVQKSILPASPLVSKHFIINSYYEPQQVVGGDIYDYFSLDDRRLRVFIADATGHGVQAALMTMVIKSEYDDMKVFLDSPGEILSILNKRFLKKYGEINTLFTCFIADIDLNSATITYASAGNPDQLILKKDGNFELLPHTGRVIGASFTSTYFDSKKSLENCSKLFVFTDGIAEQPDKNGFDFGEERFYSILSRRDFSFQELVSILRKEVYQHLGEGVKTTDDLTLISVEFNV